MADKVERVEILAHLFLQHLPQHARLRQLIHDGLLAFGGLPAFGEGIEGGKLLEQGLFGVVLEGFGHQLAIGIVILHPLGDDADRHAVDIILADPGLGATQRARALPP
ncbi:hypothetical protein D3C73_1383990 [compost metagenome]